MLRRTDSLKLDKLVGVTGTSNISHDVLIRQVLLTLGVRMPEPPKLLQSGQLELKRFCKWAYAELHGSSSEILEMDTFSSSPVATCRRATERLLKVIVLFLHDAGWSELLCEIWSKGLYQFNPKSLKEELSSQILKAEAGTLNHLLRAFSRAAEEREMKLLFLRSCEDIWGESAFGSVNALTDSLNIEVHDKMQSKPKNVKENLARQLKAVVKVLALIENRTIRVPRLVQFSRCYTDGDATHYEGYADDGSQVYCYEAGDYQLYQPYLLCAATNPASVDAVCVRMRREFWNPI